MGFLSLLRRRYIEIKIIDDEEYEKNKNFHLQLGPPDLLDSGPRQGTGQKNTAWQGKDPERAVWGNG